MDVGGKEKPFFKEISFDLYVQWTLLEQMNRSVKTLPKYIFSGILVTLTSVTLFQTNQASNFVIPLLSILSNNFINLYDFRECSVCNF